jgi:excisionase family DNA binding protein
MVKHVTEVDPEFLSQLSADIKQIKIGLQAIKALPEDEYLTADEYMARIKVSRWKLDAFVREGLLEYKKIGRKFYIPKSQVQKYFDGKMVLSQ